MNRFRLHRPSLAMVVALLALFAALGGGAYAALKLPKNSVGSKQIKANAVNSAKVKNGSLLAQDFHAGQLPAGQQGMKGDKGDKGDTGAIGPSDGYFVKTTAGTASVDVPQGSYLVWGQCFKSNSSGIVDLGCSIAATQNGGGATSNSLAGNSYAPAGHNATAIATGTATITNPAGGTMTAVSAVKVGTLHSP
jgi:hypothetical protein